MRTIIAKSPLDSIYNQYNQLLGWKCEFCGKTTATHLVTYDSSLCDRPQTVRACISHFKDDKIQ